MATVTTRKPRATAQEFEPQTELESLFAQRPDDEPDGESVENLLSELQSVEGANVKIYRVLVNNKLAWIYDCHPSEFRMEDLRDVYEGGKFRVFVYNTEDGRKMLKSSQFVFVEPKRTPAGLPSHAPANDTAALVGAMLQGMQAGFENLGRLIVQNQHVAPAVDPIGMQNAMLNNMLIMKQVLGGGAESGSTVEKALDMFRQGMQMGKELNPAAVTSDSSDVLMEALKTIGPVLAQAAAQPQAQAQAPQLPQPVIVPQPVTEEQNMFNTKRMYLNLACQKAAQNADPMLYADLILDNLPESEILAFLSAPDPLTELARIEPNVMQHREWFSGLLAEINLALAESDNADLTPHEPHVITSDNSIPSEVLDAFNGQPSEDFAE